MLGYRSSAMRGLAYLLLATCGVQSAPAYDFTDYRGLWVTRWDYLGTGPSQVQQIVDDAASLGITDLMFQVRGKSDAFYDSSYEPLADGIWGWDPLAVAIERAHTHGMKIHAWINTMPLWQGTTPPPTNTIPAHPFYNTEPSYRITDLNGNPEPLNSSYVIANPVLPEWHTHVTNVVGDILSKYEVDGIHLDYIRWLGSTSWSRLPHDEQSHQLFTAATGLPADSAYASQYRSFVRNRITDLVGSISSTVRTSNPATELSAAVWRDPTVGYNEVLQDYRTWMEQDLLDVVIPMIYLSPSNNYLFEPNLQNVLSINTNARVAPGIGVYLHDDPNFTVQQLQTLVDYETGGTTLFAWSSFFNSGQLGVDRFHAVQTFLDSVPGGGDEGGPYVSISDFEVDEGYFGSSATYSGSNSGIISATADRVTTEAFQGVGSQEVSIMGDSGGWFWRHVSGIGSIASPDGNLPLDAEGHVGFWMKTDSPGLAVSLAVDDPATADRGYLQAVVADGQWHLYEWDFGENGEWHGWVSGDGIISGPTVTLDSIQVWGAGNALFYLDEIGHNPGGSLLDVVVTGDFNGDGFFALEEIDALVAAIAGGSTDAGFDLTGDGIVDGGDLDRWLANAGAAQLPSGNPYLDGDGNLDGVVDASDFNLWNASKFTSTAAWSAGDFNADGLIDASDFNIWNSAKFSSALDGQAVPVPEPTGWLWAVMAATVAWRAHRAMFRKPV